MNNGIQKKYILLFFGIMFLGAAVSFVKYYVFPNFLQKKSNQLTQTVPEIEKSKKVPAAENSIPSPDFTLDSSVYDGGAVTLISNFEKDEQPGWQGSGVLDEKIFFEGSQSLGLVSTDRRTASVSLEKQFDLSNMKSIEFMLNVDDAEAYESAIIDFGDVEFNNYYRYSLTNLKNGWNLIQIPREKFIAQIVSDSGFDWSTIGKIRFLLLSRPSSIFWVRMDMMRSINEPESFLQHWRTNKGDAFLSLFEQDGKSKLMARNMGSNTAVLKEVEDINNFIFSASVAPLSSGRTGLFIRGNYNNGYGYYFLIGGDKKNNWQITKRNKDGWAPKEQMVEGVLQNVVFSSDKKYWLKVEANGDTMTFYFSFDGKRFEKLGEITDSEFRGGGVGITVFDGGSWSLFDDFQFKRL